MAGVREKRKRDASDDGDVTDARLDTTTFHCVTLPSKHEHGSIERQPVWFM